MTTDAGVSGHWKAAGMATSYPPEPTSRSRTATNANRPGLIERVAVGVDGFNGGEDAAALGAVISAVTNADLLLITVHPSIPFPVPPNLRWSSLRKEALQVLGGLRDSLPFEARIQATTDVSVARGLHKVARRQHRDLLIVGSPPDAEPGRVAIGRHTRQLLSYSDCALAIAPKGFASRTDFHLGRIGVGYDDSPESRAALALAASLASAAGAELTVTCVVDDRLPVLVRSALQGLLAMQWSEAIRGEMALLRGIIRSAADELGAEVNTQVVPGTPAEELRKVSEQVDLLVIGSRRSGPVARVLLGSTGEALADGCRCPMLTVPRPTP